MDLQQNRERFLNKLAAKMGKARAFQPDPMPTPVNTYPTERLTDLSPAQRADAFCESAVAFGSELITVSEAEAVQAVLDLCEKYGGGDIVLNSDERLTALGVPGALATRYNCYSWSPQQGAENISFAEKANIGIVYADFGLAETGGIVLLSDKERGRSVSLLPEKSIAILRKSQILPRVAQLSEILHEQAQHGERTPSCINIISGPSATADIELIKVIGVHGPIEQIYVLIDDL